MSKTELNDVRKLDSVIRNYSSDPEDESNSDDSFEYDEFISLDSECDEVCTDIFALTDDESLLIDSCRDVDLKELLLLNRRKNVQLMQFHAKIKNLLAECRKNLSSKMDHVKTEFGQKVSVTKVWKLGYPYFKTVDDFPCPRNEYVKRKDRNHELLFYDMSPSFKWDKRAINRLTKGVAFSYKAGREKEMKRSIVELEKELLVSGGDDKIAQLKQLTAKFDDLVKSEIGELPESYSDNLIDWQRVSEVFLEDKYSPKECRSFWYLYQSPHVNKSPWKADEDRQLSLLADIYKQQNWERITQDLGTGRSALIACTHYFTKLCRQEKILFTPEEDLKIFDLVSNYSRDEEVEWTKIAHHFKDRTRKQIFYRWNQYLKERHRTVKGGKFTEAEDVLLMILVDRFGRRFSRCQKYFPNRSMTQLKTRYYANLCQQLKKGSFSLEEDELILEHVRLYGTAKWRPLATKMSRCTSQLRQRYRVIVQYTNEHPQAALVNLPRRKAPHSKSDQHYPFLRLLADRFKNSDTIPGLAHIQRLVNDSTNEQIETDDDEDEDLPNDKTIDELLIEFFTNRVETDKKLTNSFAFTLTDSVRDVLWTLKSDLEIPHDFASDTRLDDYDKVILKQLVANLPSANRKHLFLSGGHSLAGRKSLPPTLESSVGLRTLMSMYCGAGADAKQVKWCMKKYLCYLPREAQRAIANDRKEFYVRFASAFKITAVMALTRPRKSLVNGSKMVTKQLHSVKTYGRNKVKRAKVDGTSGTSLADQLKRKIQDQITGLVRDPGAKKFFPDGCDRVTKTVPEEPELEEEDFPAPEFVSCGPTVYPRSGTIKDELDDLNSLDSILKREKNSLDDDDDDDEI